jgi:hypothetical protein
MTTDRRNALHNAMVATMSGGDRNLYIWATICMWLLVSQSVINYKHMTIESNV